VGRRVGIFDEGLYEKAESGVHSPVGCIMLLVMILSTSRNGKWHHRCISSCLFVCRETWRVCVLLIQKGDRGSKRGRTSSKSIILLFVVSGSKSLGTKVAVLSTHPISGFRGSLS
jgi:hypothetical protein